LIALVKQFVEPYCARAVSKIPRHGFLNLDFHPLELNPIFQSLSLGGGGVAHGEKVSVARDERKIFFAFFAEFFCPFRSMIAKSFKATSGSDQFSDPVGSGVFGGVAHAQRVAWGRGLWQDLFGAFLRKKIFRIRSFLLDTLINVMHAAVFLR